MYKDWEKHPVAHDLTWYEKLWTKAYTLTTASGTAVIWRAYFDFSGPGPMEIDHSIGINIPESECKNWRLILHSSSGKIELLDSQVSTLTTYAESCICVP